MSQETFPIPGPPAAGVVLVGGRSRRMGCDKALVTWGDGTLRDHVVGILSRTLAGPVVVVGPAGSARPGHAPDDPGVVEVADDAPGRGPLQGIATGLAAAATAGREVAFLCSVDLPLLHPAYVRAVLAALGPDDDVVLPVVDGHRQPLAAAYATRLGERARALLAAGARRPGDLFAASRVRELTAAELLADPDVRAADPDLHAVRDADTPDDLAALRDLARRPDPG